MCAHGPCTHHGSSVVRENDLRWLILSSTVWVPMIMASSFAHRTILLAHELLCNTPSLPCLSLPPSLTPCPVCVCVGGEPQVNVGCLFQLFLLLIFKARSPIKPNPGDCPTSPSILPSLPPEHCDYRHTPPWATFYVSTGEERFVLSFPHPQCQHSKQALYQLNHLPEPKFFK